MFLAARHVIGQLPVRHNAEHAAGVGTDSLRLVWGQGLEGTRRGCGSQLSAITWSNVPSERWIGGQKATKFSGVRSVRSPLPTFTAGTAFLGGFEFFPDDGLGAEMQMDDEVHSDDRRG